MLDTRHLQQRARRWYCVQTVPRKARAAVGRKHLVKSLETSDLAEAQRLRYAVLIEFGATIAAALAGPQPPPSLTAQAVAWREDEYAARLADDPEDEFDSHGGNRTVREDALVARAEAVEQTHGIAVARAFFQVASGEALPIDHGVDRWLAESRFDPRTQSQHRLAVRELVAWCAKAHVAPTIQALGRKEAGRWVSDAVEAGGAAPKTINRKMSSLRTYWSWMDRRGHAAANPWERQSLATKRAHGGEEDETERAFTQDELTALLTGDADAVLAGFIRIGALTGARIEEIAQLRVQDCQGGVFTIRASKSNAGRRQVPIHSALTGLVAGLVGTRTGTAWLFSECRIEAPAKGKETKSRERSMAVGKRFKTYRCGLGIDDKREGVRRSLVNFHSFRRTFITAALRAGQPLHVAQQVVGHKLPGVTLGTYYGGDTIEALRACVEAVKLPAGVA